MHVMVNVNLAEDDTLKRSPGQLATDVLTALGGDPAKDSCSVSISATSTPPPTKPAPEVAAASA